MFEPKVNSLIFAAKACVATNVVEKDSVLFIYHHNIIVEKQLAG